MENISNFILAVLSASSLSTVIGLLLQNRIQNKQEISKRLYEERKEIYSQFLENMDNIREEKEYILNEISMGVPEHIFEYGMKYQIYYVKLLLVSSKKVNEYADDFINNRIFNTKFNKSTHDLLIKEMKKDLGYTDDQK